MTGQTPAQQSIGDFAPKLVELTDDAGWPRAMSAITPARELFTSGADQ